MNEKKKNKTINCKIKLYLKRYLLNFLFLIFGVSFLDSTTFMESKLNQSTHDILFGDDESDETWTDWTNRHKTPLIILGCSTTVILSIFSFYYFNPFYVPFFHFRDVPLNCDNIDILFALLEHHIPLDDFAVIHRMLYDLDYIQGIGDLTTKVLENMIYIYSQPEFQLQNKNHVIRVLNTLIYEIKKQY